jgi:hypothetical protein
MAGAVAEMNQAPGGRLILIHAAVRSTALNPSS